MILVVSCELTDSIAELAIKQLNDKIKTSIIINSEHPDGPKHMNQYKYLIKGVSQNYTQLV